MHYQRWKKHGDPLAGRGKAADGEPMRYLREVVLPYAGEGCLTWPFATNGEGYAMVCVNEKFRLVSRIVCEDEYGPPPTDRHEAAHSCGRGGDRCVARHHLSWKTPVENAADKLIHGTHVRGERIGVAKLTEDDVREIRDSNDRQCDLAVRYSVSRALISLVKNRHVWGWLD